MDHKLTTFKYIDRKSALQMFEALMEENKASRIGKKKQHKMK